MLKKLLFPVAIMLAAVVFAQEPPPGGPDGMGGGPPPGMDSGGPPPDMGGNSGGGMPPMMGPPGTGTSGVGGGETSTVQPVTVKGIQPADLAALKTRLKAAYPAEMAELEPLFATANRLATAKMLAMAAKMRALPVSTPPVRDAVRKLRKALAEIAAAFPAEYKAMMELRDSDPAAAREELLRLYRALPAAKPTAPATATTAGETKP
ncbi:MAG: hypothetical protein AB7F40_06995 [Victivallaceae bacterium]